MEALDQTVDFETIQSDELNNLLDKFYAEAAPIFSKNRSKEMPQAQSQEYHKNSKTNIRAAINRGIQDLDRDFDMGRDKGFRKANDNLKKQSSKRTFSSD
jgi:hypothetical protein